GHDSSVIDFNTIQEDEVHTTDAAGGVGDQESGANALLGEGLDAESLYVVDEINLMMTQLAAALEADFEIEKALGEAVVFIGRVATDTGIIVSKDSEIVCYKSVKTMVRPTRYRGQYVFNVLDKSLALRKLSHYADDLVVLAVVSGNDYESNIPGKAIVTNVRIFQKIKEGRLVKGGDAQRVSPTLSIRP
ncbi:hypothetical protein SeLEV6574_g08049, partial [Synchytrium endobioticum]